MYENDGFQRTKHDIKKENRREIQCRNVFYRTRKGTRSITASEGKNMSNCDPSVHHLQRQTTVAGMKSFFLKIISMSDMLDWILCHIKWPHTNRFG